MRNPAFFLVGLLLCVGLSAVSWAMPSTHVSSDIRSASASEGAATGDRSSRRGTPVPCPLSARTLAGDPGDTRTVLCPADCLGPLVWGTDIYADDSSICVAARHAGVMDGSSDMQVTIEFLPGQRGYRGSTQNGVTSFHWGTWPRSFSVYASASLDQGTQVRSSSSDASNRPEQGSEDTNRGASSAAEGVTPFAALSEASTSSSASTSARKGSVERGDSGSSRRNQAVDCSLRGDELAGDVGTRRVLRCPSSCATESVWGVGPYTDDSSVCAAAIHAGAIPVNEGGLVRVITEGPLHDAKASSANGVKSQAWRYWPRSFRIESVR